MFDKLKIYLSYYVYNTLIHDMYSFEMSSLSSKTNKDLNLSSYL